VASQLQKFKEKNVLFSAEVGTQWSSQNDFGTKWYQKTLPMAVQRNLRNDKINKSSSFKNVQLKQEK
jgi:hypothetical protein